jgi:hypothetical protein
MEHRIMNKERSILFVKGNPKNQFWRTYLLENHPLYTGDDTVRGGLIDDPDSISWDSWLGSDVIVDKSKILNGSRIEGYFEIRSSTISNLSITDVNPDTTPRISNLIKNSTLNFHAPVGIYIVKESIIVGTCIDGYVDISKVAGLDLKNSCLTGSIDLRNCHEFLELEDCFFNGNLIFDCGNYKWENAKIEGNKIIK